MIIMSYGLGHQNDDDVHEMLLQQGLEDICDASPSERVAYLLVERARLMDELEAEQEKPGAGEGVICLKHLKVSCQQRKYGYDKTECQDRFLM